MLLFWTLDFLHYGCTWHINTHRIMMQQCLFIPRYVFILNTLTSLFTLYHCVYPFLVYNLILLWLSSDCIGSAFNSKGAMQCPNCRKIEKGQWLYSNGCRSFPEFSMDDWTHDEDLYDLSYSEMVRRNFY